MTTYERLYRDQPDSEAYALARFTKVRKLTVYLATQLNSDNYEFCEGLAGDAIARAEDMNRIRGDEVSVEIPGRYVSTGSPLVVTI